MPPVFLSRISLLPRSPRFAHLLGPFARRLCILSLVCGCATAGSAQVRPSHRIYLPDDPCVLNVKTQFGAKGDGTTDDTAALQAALDESCGSESPRSAIVYVPDGTYRITDTLIANRGKRGSGIGPYLFGESRDGVVIRLDDGVDSEKVTSVMRTHPTDSGRSSANWFMRQIRNLTFDVGDNPDVDGVRFMANNVGALRDLIIRGNGAIGVNCNFVGESGPNLIQDVIVDGFDIGIRGHFIYGQTFSRIELRNIRDTGISVSANAVGIENLVARNTPLVLRNVYPKDWHWWSAATSIIGGDFQTDDSDQPAIFSSGLLYARNIRASGYAHTIAANTTAKDEKKDGSKTGETIDGNIDEFISHDAMRLGELDDWNALPIRTEPAIVWESDPDKIVCANDFGMESGDNQDDTAALQRAIDEAAKRGATTVTIRGIRRKQKRSWYDLDNETEVHVHGSVRTIMGLGFARILRGKFVVDDDSADSVTFMNLHNFGGPPLSYIQRSKNSTMIIDSASGTVIGEGQGDIFLTNTAGHVELRHPGASCWARHMNPEGERDGGLIQNHGGRLWVLGTKTEGRGLRYQTTSGGVTELHGVYSYTNTPVDPDDPTPIYKCENASMLVTGHRETCFNGKPYGNKMTYQHDGETQSIDRKAARRRFHTFIAGPRSQ